MANAVAQSHGNGIAAFQLRQDRPEIVTNGSSHVRQLQRFQELADNSLLQPVKPGNSAGAHSDQGTVVQRVVKVGADSYRPHKRGYGIKDLIALVEAQGASNLRFGWKAKLKDYTNETGVVPRPFTDINDLIAYLTKSKKKTQSEKNQEQDQRILGLNTGYGNTELGYGKILSYESEKAFGTFTGQVEGMKEYTDTKMELEKLDPDERSTTNNFTKSGNPFVNTLALGNSNLRRLDFMAPNGVEIDTHGYSSKKDRSVDPGTLSDKFSWGTVKIGPDISSYKKEMETNNTPDQDQMSYLNPLEMIRLPRQSVHTGMKRELYDQGQFTKDQGMGFNHNHSSVEFVGAVNGSGLTNQQLQNMRKQQTLSNYAILETANNICPNTGIGQALGNGKHVPTPKEEMDALTRFIDVVNDPKSTQKDKDKAKKELRKIMVQLLRGVTQLEDVESEDDTKYPTSPYNPIDYN